MPQKMPLQAHLINTDYTANDCINMYKQTKNERSMS